MQDEGRFADAVIVAAGSSRRMGGVDKLDEDLGGRSVLERSVGAMAAGRSVRNVVVVVAPERVDRIAATPWATDLRVRVVAGGARRQDSVAAGVRAASAEIVLVHDGARPLVPASLVDAVADAARANGAAVPVIPVADSLRTVQDGRVTGSVARDGVFAAQTPQGARRELLMQALDALAGGDEVFTDEAELLGRYGVPVSSVAGDPANLKLTVPSDLIWARALDATGGAPGGQRVGSGMDIHPFGPQMGLRLCGVEIPEAPRLHGHSDGDVALHALCDALLGAAGLPDIGRAFPSGAQETRGIDSTQLLASVLSQVAELGWQPWSVDVTIVGSRPRLGGRRLDAMAASIAGLLDVPVDRVAVKASSGNLSGDEGAGRVIRADVAVTLVAR